MNFFKKDPARKVLLTKTTFVAHHDSSEDTSQPKFLDLYEKGDKIDGLSNTYHCIHKNTKQARTVKVYKKETKEDNFWKELSALKLTDAAGILTVHESFETDNFLYIVYLENLEGFCNLLDAIKLDNRYKHFTEKHATEIVCFIVLFLSYLHKVEIEKDEKGNPQFVAISHGRINAYSYLGSNKDEHEAEDCRRKSFAGESHWKVLVNYEMATIRKIDAEGSYGSNIGDDTSILIEDFDSEGALAGKTKQSNYDSPEFAVDEATPKGDIYSCGVLAYYLVTGKFPYKSLPAANALQPPNTIDFSGFKIPQFKKFIHDSLQMNPDHRPTAKEALAVLQEINKSEEPEFDNEIPKDVLKRLSGAQKLHKLQEAVKYWMTMTYVASDEDVYKELLQTFQFIDTDQNQVLTKEELGKAFECRGIHLTQKQLEQTYKHMDLNKDGKVELSEFLACAADWNYMRCRDKLEAAFNEFDISKTGYITGDDLRGVFQQSASSEDEVISQKAAQAMIDKADKNGDGKLSLDEFYSMMWVNQVQFAQKKIKDEPQKAIDIEKELKWRHERLKAGYGYGVGGGIFG